MQLRNNIEIVGLSDIDSNDTKNAALKVFSSCRLSIDVPADQIVNSYVKKIRVSAENDSINNSRDVFKQVLCVKLASENIKQSIMKKKFMCKKRLNSTSLGSNYGNGPIYINESLTAATRSLLAAAKKEQLNKKYKFLWIRNADILLRKKEGDSVVVIKSVGDLEKLK